MCLSLTQVAAPWTCFSLHLRSTCPVCIQTHCMAERDYLVAPTLLRDPLLCLTIQLCCSLPRREAGVTSVTGEGGTTEAASPHHRPPTPHAPVQCNPTVLYEECSTLRGTKPRWVPEHGSIFSMQRGPARTYGRHLTIVCIPDMNLHLSLVPPSPLRL